MSSVAVNDENCAVFPGRRNSSSPESKDIFDLDQPTGRPSILRQSQAENLPNKTVAKGVKVCFQTPRRDPVTKRIVSPTKSLKLTCLDECMKAMESLQLQSTAALPQDGVELVDGPPSEVSSYPDDYMPIQSHGGYQLDFDNLDAINPFGESSKMVLSPAKPAVQDLPTGQNEPQASDSFTPEKIFEEPAKTETTLDETLPFSPSVENSLADMSTDIPSTDSSVVTVAKNPAAESSSTITDEEPSAATCLSLDRDEASANTLSVEDAPLPAKGAYSFDFDDLDSIDLFQTGGSKMQNSPALGRKLPSDDKPVKESEMKQMESADIVKVPEAFEEAPSTDGSVVTVAKNPAAESSSTITDEEPSAATRLSLDRDEASANASSVDDTPLPARGAYSFDDYLNSIDPFQTGGSKILDSLESQSSSTIADKEPSAATCLSLDRDEASANTLSVEDAPLPAKGAYSFDFDDLDSIDPFQTGGSKMQDSPALGRKLPSDDKPVKESEMKQMESADIVKVPEAFEEAPSTDGSVVTVAKNPAAESSSTITDEEPSAATCLSLDRDEASANTRSVEDAPLPTKGTYSFDFDNLASIDPFQTGGSKMQNSPALGRKLQSDDKPVKESEMKQMESADIVKVPEAFEEAPSTDGSVVTVAKNPAAESSSTITDEEPSAATCLSLDRDEASANTRSVEDAPLPTKGTYSFDFDNLASIDPFQTGGSKMQNSPALGRKLQSDDKPVKESEMKRMQSADIVKVPEASADIVKVPEASADIVKVPEAFEEAPVLPEIKPVAAVAPILNDATKPADAQSTSQPTAAPPKDGPVKLEFNFDDGGEVRRKPPPKKFGKKPPGLKPTEKNVVPVEKDSLPLKESAAKPAPDHVDEVPPPKRSYTFDLDKFDDPNFNPLGTGAKMTNSKCRVKSNPAGNTAPVPVKEAAAPEQMPKPVEHETPSSMCGDSVSKTNGSNPAALKQSKTSEDQEVKAVTSHALRSQPELEQPVRSTPEPPELGQLEQNGLSELNEEFVPGAMFMSNDFDGRQIDYLEQFGSSNFKESVLRKQSLYLKFDPLLKESPSKAGGLAAQNHHHPRPSIAPFASRLEAQQTGAKQATHGPKKNDFKLLDYVPLLNPPMLQNLVHPFPQPENAEGAIIEVLKYSQKDMDAAIAKVQAEAKEKDEQWSAKNNKLFEENQKVRKERFEYENAIEQIMTEQRKEKKMAQVVHDQVLQEKEQVSQDLNSMERSFTDLFKRLEKYKNAIDGFKKNEDTLKRCAQDYLAKVKTSELCFLNLKAHAEEKITKANAEIAEVRSKFKAESATFHAQLRRDQLKVHSLEKALDQKVKECEELTKLCDELIANAQKF